MNEDTKYWIIFISIFAGISTLFVVVNVRDIGVGPLIIDLVFWGIIYVLAIGGMTNWTYDLEYKTETTTTAAPATSTTTPLVCSTTPSELSDNCLQKMWKDAGCSTTISQLRDPSVPNNDFGIFNTNWWKNRPTISEITTDMTAWNTLTDPRHQTLCHGSGVWNPNTTTIAPVAH